MSGEERRLFNLIKEAIQVEDKFPIDNRIKFSWNSRRNGEGRILTRLDRAYTFKNIDDITNNSEYKILGDSAHLDHISIWRQVWLVPETSRKTAYVMSNFYLKDPIVHSKIEEICNKSSSLPFFEKLRKCVKFYKGYCLKKAVTNRQEVEALRKEYAIMVEKLERDPNNLAMQRVLATLKDDLHQFEQTRSRIKWKQVVDRCSNEFFQVHRQRSSASHITALEDQHRRTHPEQEVLAQVCDAYYQNLYKARDPPIVVEETQRHSRLYLQDKIGLEAKLSLSSPITLVELETAMKDMAIGKSPGPDGIILDFYRIYWEIIGKDYWLMIIETIHKGQLPKGVTKAMIALLHKGGQRSALTNWRPITILNIGYKIYAKALQLRLQLIVMDIISPEQSSFLPLRFILDNVLLTQKTLA